MAEFTRAELLACLETDWGSYADRFRALSAAEQAAWLVQQGYGRFADLLAHVIAWWSDGYVVVEHLARGGAPAAKEYDETAFNAAAVALCGPRRGSDGGRV